MNGSKYRGDSRYGGTIRLSDVLPATTPRKGRPRGGDYSSGNGRRGLGSVGMVTYRFRDV